MADLAGSDYIWTRVIVFIESGRPGIAMASPGFRIDPRDTLHFS